VTSLKNSNSPRRPFAAGVWFAGDLKNPLEEKHDCVATKKSREEKTTAGPSAAFKTNSWSFITYFYLLLTYILLLPPPSPATMMRVHPAAMRASSLSDTCEGVKDNNQETQELKEDMQNLVQEMEELREMQHHLTIRVNRLQDVQEAHAQDMMNFANHPIHNYGLRKTADLHACIKHGIGSVWCENLFSALEEHDYRLVHEDVCLHSLLTSMANTNAPLLERIETVEDFLEYFNSFFEFINKKMTKLDVIQCPNAHNIDE
jgi:hypothetical protein